MMEKNLILMIMVIYFLISNSKFYLNYYFKREKTFFRSIYAKRVQELLSNIEPSKCIMSQNGDMIFDAVDYEQTQYCVESSGETYSKENGHHQTTKKLPLEMHVPR